MYRCSQCGYGDAQRYLANPNLRGQQQITRAARVASFNQSASEFGSWVSNLDMAVKIGIGVAAAMLLLFFAVFVSFQNQKPPINQTTNSASIVNTQNPPNYEKLTFNSTYYDVIAAFGTPDNEVSAKPPEAQIPNTMLFYYKKTVGQPMIVFLAYDMPFSGKFNKNKTHYLGTKGLSPERVLHVSKEQYRVLIDAYKFVDKK
jgi:hypothetical protein